MDNNEMTLDQQMIRELVTYKRKKEQREKLMVWVVIGAGLCVIAAALLFLYRLLPTVRVFNELMSDVNNVKPQILSILDAISSEDVDNVKKAVSTFSNVTADDFEKIRTTLTQVNQILSFFVGN
ncbi:MAG: hypothetical protein IJL94_01720 [Erysipelotrichaceae bacterium]|nr:hypothetical protein [Erysipelotrichaceae bacterium]